MRLSIHRVASQRGGTTASSYRDTPVGSAESCRTRRTMPRTRLRNGSAPRATTISSPTTLERSTSGSGLVTSSVSSKSSLSASR